MAVEIYNFFELTAVFDLKPEDAIRHFQNKGLKTSFSWMDMIGEENDAAFTVAKMMDNDLLSYVDKQVDKAIDEGLTLADFKKDLIPRLQKAGWWGKKDVVDPLTGQVTKAQLGKQKGSADLSATELLAKAKTKAASIEQSVLLNQYKKAQVNSKQPNAKALAAYNDLPEAAQQAIDQDIELKTGQYQAKETLQDIKDNPKGQTLMSQIPGWLIERLRQ